MKTLIAVQIEPDDDGVRCGGCPNLHFSDDSATDECWFGWVNWTWDGEKYVAIRGPKCLAAQTEHDGLYERAQSANDCSKCEAVDKAKLRALIETLKVELEDLENQCEHFPPCTVYHGDDPSICSCSREAELLTRRDNLRAALEVI